MSWEPEPRDAEPGREDPAAAAAAWLARRDRGFTRAEAGEFERWLAASPAHAAEFNCIDAVWGRLARAKADPEIAAMARRLDERSGRRPPPVRLAWAAGFAAAAVAAVVWWVGAGRTPAPGPSRAAEQAPDALAGGTVREMQLPDGSVVETRGDGQVEVDFTAAVRNVRLVRGEANFIVAKNPARPFVVTAGPVRVRDVGTAFNVQYGAAAVAVLVTEGEVRVEDARPARPADPLVPRLVAGQRARIFRNAAGSAGRVAVDLPDDTAVARTLAGASRWIVFDRTPLGTAVAEFNRHSSQRIVLGDPSLQPRLLGGMFRTDNAAGFVRLLEASLEVRAERRGDDFVLLPAR